MKFSALALVFGAILVSAASQASAATINFDDHTVGQPPDSYPTVFQGPIGFSDGGFQFSNNAVILNVSSVANGPAHSGNNAMFNDYFGFGYGPEFTVTQVGGGTFSFSGLYAQSFSHSANDPITVGIEGFRNGIYVGIIPILTVLDWTNISLSSPGAVGSFANIDTLIIRASDYALIDDIGLSANVATTPIPGALLLFTSALSGLGLFGWKKKRQASGALAA